MIRRSNLLAAAGIVAVLALIGVVVFRATTTPANEWAYDATGIRDAQGRGLDGKGIVVAVADTGFNTGHPALSKVTWTAWKDFVNGRAEPYDDAGHGSHVTGILAGQGGSFSSRLQGLALRGAAPGVTVIPIKVISNEGSGTNENVAAGIDYAVAQRADIICLSLGGQSRPLNLFSDQLELAVQRATDRGVLVVASAGNTGEDSSRTDVESPAASASVIGVGSVGRDLQVSDFTARGSERKNYGTGALLGTPSRTDPNKKPEIVAPGEHIVSAWTGKEYRSADGTSQAAPFVCGALALLLQENPSLTRDDTSGLVTRVKNALASSAQDIEGAKQPHDPAAGYGLLRADKLLDAFAT